MSVRSRQAKVFAALLVSITVGAIILKALGNNPPSAGAFCLSRYYRLDPVEKSILSRAAQYPGRWSHIEINYSGTGAPTKPAEGGYDQGRRCRPGNAATCGSNKHTLDTQRESRIQNRDSRFHFVVCNGSIGHDGQILPTEIWQRQCSPHQLYQCSQSQTGDSQRSIGGGQLVRGKTPTSRSSWQLVSAKRFAEAGSSPEPDSEQTIYICVIADDKVTRPVRNSTMGNMIQKGKITNGARPTDFQIKRTEALVEGLSRKFNIRPESIHYPDNWQ